VEQEISCGPDRVTLQAADGQEGQPLQGYCFAVIGRGIVSRALPYS
jgi:hypothetical protein